ncbi:MAG: hypothetical protein NE327_02510, partial [Lentisphaeraceae bacterium]|nr:hypothetical protein [Lentisphaeraceae bacterium]
MDISANNIPYWMIEQTVPASIEGMHSKKEESNGRIQKVDPSEKNADKEDEKLKERDREVRQHENAHLAAAGPHARGGPHYTFQNGNDGNAYAIGGHV